jgi:cytoskeletal protein CcmA (bactofilin family)
MRAFKSIAAFVMTVALTPGVVLQSQAAPSDRPSPRADNYYSAGNQVEVTTPMGADVIVAGRQIDIARPVAGDIWAAGWRVVLSDRADDDVRIAAGEVKVDAAVAGDLTIAGGDVTLGPQTRVGGRSWLTGGTVRLNGIFEREVHVTGATVQIAGEIRQPLAVTAEALEILPSARILGPLTYKGSSVARIAEGAIVNGPITYDKIPQREAERARAFPAISGVLFAFHLLLVGLLVVFFLPRVETSVVATLRTRPGWSLLTGFALVVVTPIAAVLLVITILGLPIGLAMGALYAIALFSAVVTTAFFVGDVEARLLHAGPIVTRGQHALLLVAGVLTLALMRSVLGGFVVVTSVLFGFGALALSAYQAYTHVSAPAAV